MTVSTETLTGVHKAMASTMAASWSEIPHFAEIVQVDATVLKERLRTEREALAGDANAPRISINDLVVHAAIEALGKQPALNGVFVDGKIERPDNVSVAVAIATDHGLMTPVLKDAASLTLKEISSSIVALREAADRRRLGAEAFEGAVMTISNLGAYGVDTGFPTINRRQSALLFVGSLADRPVVIDGEVVARPTMYLTLACDHRVVDGLTAAHYLTALRGIIEGETGA